MASPKEKLIELKPIKETTEDFEALEKRIKELFRRTIYLPLLKELGEPRKILKNAADEYESLLNALFSGRVTFNRGTFSGRFNAGVSKDLKRLGAQWDRKTGTFKIFQSSLPIEVRNAVSASHAKFAEKIASIDKKLAGVLPEDVAAQLKSADLFDSTLWKTDKAFHASVKNITVAPQLSASQRKRIVAEWQTNMQLFIKDFTEKEITKLRGDLKESVFAGNRFESAVSSIQKSYGVSANKAKFLARQETSLLMTKFKQTRYQESGVEEYKWGCVHRPKDKSPSQHTPGNVRYFHGVLDGRIFRWDSPPIVDEHGNKKNPGQDYNCRCFARPIVRFKTK